MMAGQDRGQSSKDGDQDKDRTRRDENHSAIQEKMEDKQKALEVVREKRVSNEDKMEAAIGSVQVRRYNQ
jgi:hypothetical protein